MSGLGARFEVVENLTGKPLVIRDVGSDCLSVTNDAERVVRQLCHNGLLPDGRRLFYYDTEGTLDELLVRDGEFAGFAPGPRP